MANETQDASDWAGDAEQRLLDEALILAPLQGWTWPMVRAAGRAIGLSDSETELLVPHGPSDLAALLARRHDTVALAALSDPAGLKIRERIRAAVAARLDAAAADEAAVRRWAGYLALPLNLPLAGRLLWESADALWRWAGDTATDENHYSKRAILSGILASALAIRLSSGREAAMSFVDARIENVMTYEKWKAGLKAPNLLQDLAGALGRIRYGKGA
ncbi:MAG: COQ9 family protein [Phenylobacterium sp.]|uniref:COQ9 family protein n=1 Tax=Phenylobacterium sp. TaxID=1871053 RepID=UPI00391CB232